MRTQALVIFSLLLIVSLCKGYVDISKQTPTAVVNGRKCPQLFDVEMPTTQLKDGGIYAISFLAASGKAEVWDPSEQNVVKRVRARLSKEPAQNLKAYLEALNPTMLQKVKKGAASALDFITGFIPYLNTVKAFVGLAVDAGQLYKDEAVKTDATFYMQCLDKLQANQDLPFSELMSNLIAREGKTVKTEIINAFKQATTGFGNVLSCVHIPVHHIPTALNGLASIYARWGGHAQIEAQTQNVDDLRKDLKTILAQSKKHADMVESKAPAIIRSLVEMDDAAATELVRTISACRSVQNTPRYCNTIDGNYMTYQIQKFGVYLQYFLANRMDVLPDIFEGLPHDKAVALVNEALETAPCAK